jgi:preprotein translocase subunit YajC
MGEANWHTFLPIVAFMVLIVVIFWGTIVRPQAQAQRRHQELVKSLQVGDQVITAGGIYGKLTALKEDTVTLEIAPDVRVVFDRRTVRRRVG